MDNIDVYYYAGNEVKQKLIKRLMMKNYRQVTNFQYDVTRFYEIKFLLETSDALVFYSIYIYIIA